MASQAGFTAPPTRVSARAGTARSSAASAGLAKQHAEHKPDAKGRGKPPGAKDLKSRKARNGAGNYRNSQNPKHRQLEAVNEVSGALHEVSKYIKACPKEVQNTIAQHKHLLRWRNPSGDLDLSKPGDKRTFQRRNTEIAAVTGNDTSAHFAKMLEGTHLDARQLKIIITGLNERLGKMPRSSVRALGVAFAHALDGPEALEIKLRCNLSDGAYNILRNLLDPEILPCLSRVKIAQFERSPDVIPLAGVTKGAILKDPIAVMERAFAQVALNMTTAAATAPGSASAK